MDCFRAVFRRIAAALRPAPALAAAALALALVAGATSPGAAQLGAGDLQRAHALTANSAGWIVLRAAMRHLVEVSGVASGDNLDETADTLAVLLALEDGDGRLDSIVIGAVRGAVTANAARDPAVDRVFAAQGLTLARAKAISCLVYGQAPEERASISEALGLGPEEIDACPKAYAGFRDHWLKIAAPLRAAESGTGRAATVDLSPAGGTMASARAVMIAGQTLHAVAAFFSDSIASPVAISIRALDCDVEQPEPEPDEIRVCYRLVGELATGVERGIVAGR